jgi:hypothetical protein
LQFNGTTLGVAVTPNSNWSGYKAIQFGDNGSVANSGGTSLFGWNVYYDGSYKYLQTGSSSMMLISPGGAGGFAWSTAGSGSAGNAITFTTAMTLDVSSNLTLNTGNLVIGTSGKGIDFSITNQPAGMTSELFADYEEGTWTPSVGNQTVVGTFSRNGTYTKIGRQVFFRGQVFGSTSIAGAAGSYIGGLPYTSTASGTGSGTIANQSAGAIIFIGPGDTNVYIIGGYAATGNFEFSGMYFA